MDLFRSLRSPLLRTSRLWLPGYVKHQFQLRRRVPAKRLWVAIADHFEPWWRDPGEDVALDRVRRWARIWPAIAERHRDSEGRPACYTFFYPEEQYHPQVMDRLAALREAGVGDVEVHLHHDRDTPQSFVDRLSLFNERLHRSHGLLRVEGGKIRFGFIHGNWALDNSLPDGRFCGLNNEITLLRDLGCYADFTLPSAPSAAQTRTVNTIYWAKDDPLKPKSHDGGVPVIAGGPVAGDLMLIPGPLTLNLREWRAPRVPRLETGELAGNCLPTQHRAHLWVQAAPRIGEDVFLKLFGHGAPEKNALPLLEGALDRTFDYLKTEATRQGMKILFVSAWQMWSAVEAIRRNADPLTVLRNVYAARTCSKELP